MEQKPKKKYDYDYAGAMRKHRRKKKEEDPLVFSSKLYLITIDNKDYYFKNKKDILTLIKKVDKQVKPNDKVIL
jgi:hypothetical protein